MSNYEKKTKFLINKKGRECSCGCGFHPWYDKNNKANFAKNRLSHTGWSSRTKKCINKAHAKKEKAISGNDLKYCDAEFAYELGY